MAIKKSAVASSLSDVITLSVILPRTLECSQLLRLCLNLHFQISYDFSKHLPFSIIAVKTTNAEVTTSTAGIALEGFAVVLHTAHRKRNLQDGSGRFERGHTRPIRIYVINASVRTCAWAPGTALHGQASLAQLPWKMGRIDCIAFLSLRASHRLRTGILRQGQLQLWHDRSPHGSASSGSK
mmetsp:Transcript_50689/g.94685  ORF Transcript_50689/g.94685 Transcript_50689/m.94685 type:complete len:182 (-) Transcript_50689:1096-1641(-)